MRYNQTPDQSQSSKEGIVCKRLLFLALVTIFVGCQNKTDWSVVVTEGDKDYKIYEFDSECVEPITKEDQLIKPNSGICVALHGSDTNTDWNRILFSNINRENLEGGEEIGENLYYSIPIQWVGDINKTENLTFELSEKDSTLFLTTNKEIEEEYQRAWKEYERAGEEMSRAFDNTEGKSFFVLVPTYDGGLRLEPSPAAKVLSRATEKKLQASEKYERVRKKREAEQARIVKNFLHNLKTYKAVIAEIPCRFSKSDFQGATPIYFRWELSGLQRAYNKSNKEMPLHDQAND